MTIATPPTLPTIAGLSWSVHKKPANASIVASHVSGREVIVPKYAYPLYEFEANYDGLASGSAYPGLGADSLQTLMGFFLQMQGQAGFFLYADPTDCSTAAEPQGNGDGSTTSFTIGRAIGGWSEPVGWVTDLENVYLEAELLSPSDYSFAAPNVLTFATAPGAGVPITCDFTYAFVCRFLADQYDFENFMNGLWKLDKLTFRSVKGYGG